MSLSRHQIRLIEYVKAYALHKPDLRPQSEKRQIWALIGHIFGETGKQLEKEWNHIQERYFELNKNKDQSLYNGVLDFLEELRDTSTGTFEHEPNVIAKKPNRKTKCQAGNVDINIDDPLKIETENKKKHKKCPKSLLDINCVDTEIIDFFEEVAAYTDTLPIDNQKKLRLEIYDLVLKAELEDLESNFT